MNHDSYDEKVMFGVYGLARRNERLSAERKALSKKIRVTKAAARLDEITRRFHIAIALLAVGGALPIVVLTGRSRIEDLPILIFCLCLCLSGLFTAYPARKVQARQNTFLNRYRHYLE
ncbi:hypothetical protein [Rhizobium binae]|uniref:hypothetical protein n=1 Tax=Rhizobium binae TaxID=1138190 RepID=UPI001C829718|nr:hypothetical protein [Rhizobium binae]MBX4928709.1 hypothetical protein [Rhizobium binae]